MAPANIQVDRDPKERFCGSPAVEDDFHPLWPADHRNLVTASSAVTGGGDSSKPFPSALRNSSSLLFEVPQICWTDRPGCPR
jgi:hypothetical protein